MALAVRAGLSAWWHFVFSAQLTKYSHTITLRYFPHWNVLVIFVFFLLCLMSSIPYIIIVLFPFSHWKQGIVELTAILSLLASWFVVRQIAVPPVGSSVSRSFVFRCSISMIFTPDFTVIPTSFECSRFPYIIVFMHWWFLCHIIVVFVSFSHWEQMIVELAAFSSLVVLWVVITTSCGAIGGGGVMTYMITSFQCSINMISTHSFTVTRTSLKCAWYVVKLFYYARIISLQYYYSFLTESIGSPLWWLWRRWLHRELLVRRIAVLPLSAGFIGWTLAFSARLTWYLLLILL